MQTIRIKITTPTSPNIYIEECGCGDEGNCQKKIKLKEGEVLNEQNETTPRGGKQLTKSYR